MSRRKRPSGFRATEFRVVWRREGISRAKSKRFATEKAARRHMALLGPEPWLALGKGPDDPACGHDGKGEAECGSCGLTVREADARYRAEAPPVLWRRLESRPTSNWIFVEDYTSVSRA